jgi:hypothetical protein
MLAVARQHNEVLLYTFLPEHQVQAFGTGSRFDCSFGCYSNVNCNQIIAEARKRHSGRPTGSPLTVGVGTRGQLEEPYSIGQLEEPYSMGTLMAWVLAQPPATARW